MWGGKAEFILARSSRGFTLVEVLIGVALLGALSLGFMALLSNAQKGANAVQNRVDFALLEANVQADFSDPGVTSFCQGAKFYDLSVSASNDANAISPGPSSATPLVMKNSVISIGAPDQGNTSSVTTPCTDNGLPCEYLGALTSTQTVGAAPVTSLVVGQGQIIGNGLSLPPAPPPGSPPPPNYPFALKFTRKANQTTLPTANCPSGGVAPCHAISGNLTLSATRDTGRSLGSGLSSNQPIPATLVYDSTNKVLGCQSNTANNVIYCTYSATLALINANNINTPVNAVGSESCGTVAVNNGNTIYAFFNSNNFNPAAPSMTVGGGPVCQSGQCSISCSSISGTPKQPDYTYIGNITASQTPGFLKAFQIFSEFSTTPQSTNPLVNPTPQIMNLDWATGGAINITQWPNLPGVRFQWGDPNDVCAGNGGTVDCSREPVIFQATYTKIPGL